MNIARMPTILRKLTASALLVIVVGAAGVAMNACAYAGVATTPDGTVIIARNDYLLFGLLRKVYSCKSNGAQLACVEITTPP